MSTCAIEYVLRYENGSVHRKSDELAEEEPLEIRVRGRAISVTMRTSGHDRELAAGFLLSERVINGAGDILDIRHCDGNEYDNVMNVQLAPDVALDWKSLTRHVFASSSCGLCGITSVEAVSKGFVSIVDESLKIGIAVLSALPQAMRHAQETFDRTGGLHAAAIFDADGKMVVLREDVGRHNAVDKVLGYALLNNLLPLKKHILLLSGRCSFEIMQKALAGGLPVVAAVSAPSSLAVSFAAESGQTLIGFLRGDRMNVYAGFDRVRFE